MFFAPLASRVVSQRILSALLRKKVSSSETTKTASEKAYDGDMALFRAKLQAQGD